MKFRLLDPCCVICKAKDMRERRQEWCRRHRILTVFAYAISMLSGTNSVAENEVPLKVAVPSLPSEGLNPLYNATYPAITVLPAVFDGLTTVSISGEAHGSLAKSWTQVDELTWRFDLRPGVLFSNGEIFNAASVRAAFDYLKTEQGARTVVARSIDMVERVAVEGDHSISIVTNRPEPRLPWHLTSVRIPAPKLWRELGSERFALEPAGTGPFMQEDRSEGKISLSAFQGAWAPANHHGLEFWAVPESSARLQGLQTGVLDIAIGLNPDDQFFMEQIGGDFVVEKSFTVFGLSFVTTKDSPVVDPRVRLALNLAVNRPAIVAVLYGGASQPTSQLPVREAFGYVPELEPYPFDPDRARSLLREAGYEDGFDFPVEVTTSMGGNASAIFQQIAVDLSRVGVNTTLTPLSNSQFVRNILSSSWDGLAFIINYDSGAALDGLRPFRMHSCLRPIPWFCNEDDTDLILAAEREGDLSRRLALTQDLVRRYYNNPPGIMLYEAVGFVGLSSRVTDYRADYGVIDFRKVSVSNAQ